MCECVYSRAYAFVYVCVCVCVCIFSFNIECPEVSDLVAKHCKIISLYLSFSIFLSLLLPLSIPPVSLSIPSLSLSIPLSSLYLLFSPSLITLCVCDVVMAQMRGQGRSLLLMTCSLTAHYSSQRRVCMCAHACVSVCVCVCVCPRLAETQPL